MQRGGKCLSKEYINGKTKLLWECSEGHQWEAILDSVKRGSWCAVCKKTKKKTHAVSHWINLPKCLELALSNGVDNAFQQPIPIVIRHYVGNANMDTNGKLHRLMCLEGFGVQFVLATIKAINNNVPPNGK